MKEKYYFTNYPPQSIARFLTALAQLVLDMVDNFFEMFQMYADESELDSPRQILHNLIRNNESIFGLGIFDTNPSTSTSSQGQSRRESSSPVKEESSSCPSVNKSPILDKTQDLGSENLEKETADADIQESVAIFPKPELPAEGDKMGISPAKDSETETNPSEARKVSDKSDENVPTTNRSDIKSISVIRRYDTVMGVEIEIGLVSKSVENSPSKPEQASSPSEKNSPGKTEKKSKSPSSCSPSKPLQSTASPSIPRKSRKTVDYMDPKILEFLTERLLSILSCRKEYIVQIHAYFKTFHKDVFKFSDIVTKINDFVQRFPVRLDADEDLLLMRYHLRKEGPMMWQKSQSLLRDIEKDISVTEKCLAEIKTFEKQQLKKESCLTIDEIKKFESDLKEICKEVDASVIHRDGGRTVLLGLSPRFDWLYKHYIKFLVLSRALRLVGKSS